MGLSIWHILLFAIVVILLFGTSKLKNLGRDLGGAIKDFKDSVKEDNTSPELNSPSLKNINITESIKEKSPH